MTAHRVYKPGDVEHVRLVSREVAFAVMDPGAAGVVLAWEAGPRAERWPRRPEKRIELSSRAGGADIAARLCAELGVRVLIVEDQYLGRKTRNFATTKTLILTSGIVIGHIMGACELDDLVLVHPSSWQVGLPPGPDMKTRAVYHANRNLPGWLVGRQALRSACADAFGMADWFASGEIT